ncbi:MAG: MFS transporter [Candidatus Bathyarchaeia archaeon]
MLEYLGFFLHEAVFGFLSVFFPLYIILIGGSLIDVGLISMFALLSAIVSSFFWGYLCDRLKRYKWSILLSFASIAVILYLFMFVRSIMLLTLLYALLSVFHMAHEPSKNVIISETYEHDYWIRAFAFYEGFTEIGWLVGLLLGFLTSIYNFNAETILLVCSLLHLTAFASSIFFVSDPPLSIERKLVRIEKTVDLACKGLTVLSGLFSGVGIDGRVGRENIYGFCVGLTLFIFATSMLFTPLPVFLMNLPILTGGVFAILALNSLGGVLGYLTTMAVPQWSIEKSRMWEIAALRGILTLLIVMAVNAPSYNTAIIASILMVMGFAYAVFYVYTLSTSMALVSEGKVGLFNTLVGVGNVLGSFTGPYIAQTMGFTHMFIAVGGFFLISSIVLKFST